MSNDKADCGIQTYYRPLTARKLSRTSKVFLFARQCPFPLPKIIDARNDWGEQGYVTDGLSPFARKHLLHSTELRGSEAVARIQSPEQSE
jgi:hypothetical protein